MKLRLIKRDLVIRARHDRVHRIAVTNRAYDVLQYLLMISGGEDGYYFTVRDSITMHKTSIYTGT